MPPFRLELPDREPREKVKYLFIAKKTYNPNVYITGWNQYISSLPFDNNPFDEDKVDHHVSHYNHLGTETCTDYTTTTSKMLEQIKKKDLINTPYRTKMLNVLSVEKSKICTEERHWCGDKCFVYSTTMQESYRAPYPYAMKRLALPKTPHLLYRKMKEDQTILCEDKFLDDSFIQHTRDRICAKKSQYISYNPITGLNTDGTLPKGDKVQKCYILG